MSYVVLICVQLAVFTVQVVVWFGYGLEEHASVTLVSMWVCWNLGLFVTCLYSNVMIWLVLSMYRRRRFEFQVHIRRMLTLYIATMIGVSILVVYTIYSQILAVCVLASNNQLDVSEAFYDADDPRGICKIVIETFETNTSFSLLRNYSAWVTLIDMFMLMPMIGYLFCNEPHDCFVCIGRDPDRAYSMFQLTVAERVERKMIAKYNAKKRKRLMSEYSMRELARDGEGIIGSGLMDAGRVDVGRGS